jgi:glucose/mannose-6-phosphate isomerase
MADLDSPGRFVELDPRGMLSSIAGLPDDCEDAWRKASSVQLPRGYRGVRQVVIVGIGGSGIGGDLLRTLVALECSVPILVHRDYQLPAFIDGQTLVVVCSYSGNTEEALTGFDQATDRGARLVAIASGGDLAQRTLDRGLPLYTFAFRTQPRAALGYLLMSMLGVMQTLDLIGPKSDDVAEAVAVMRQWQEEINPSVPASENAAKRLAAQLYGRLPVVYAAEHLGEVARRWKGQFNENSKSWAVFDLLPELNHNSVVGYPLPSAMATLTHVMMLTSKRNHPRVLRRFAITRELLQRHGYAVGMIEARGKSALAEMLSLVHFGDFVSYYLAMLYDVDPWSVGNIDFVKKELAVRS